MVEQAFNPSTQEAETDDFCELKASLFYRTSYRMARAQRKIEKNQKSGN